MQRFKIDFLIDYDDASLLAELQRITKVTGSETVTKKDLKRVGRVSHNAIVRHFGSLRRALQLAGLKTTRFMKATDEELISILIELWEKVLEKEGRSPQEDDLRKYEFPLSHDTITRRFGSWRKALVKAAASVTDESVSKLDESAPETQPRKREALSLRKRFFVLKHDHFACVRCGASGVGVRLEVHHRFPFAKGGSDSLANLETLCYACNRGQRDSVV
ncbi:MAG TPA: HNH endonuclease [Candidatus Acidoferrales bacterium]|nr:HNH endonuclease [Candidatus Acidoferrales bacterium]